MIPSQWFSVLLDYDRTGEFTGDDATRYSAVCDLEGNYEFVTVICPIMDIAKVTPYIQRTPAVTEVPTVMHILDADATGSLNQNSTDVSTFAIAVTFRMGGAQYLRLHTNHAQTDDRTFYVRGFNRD